MPELFYTTVENQVRADGSKGLLYDWFFEEEGARPAIDRAKAKYHAACAEAAVSDCKYHAVYVLCSNGTVTEQAVWDRREQE